MFVRKARRKDRQAMKACNERNLPENYELSYWEEKINDYKSYVLLNEEKNIVGYCLCDGEQIISLAIDELYRRKGWGETLLKKCIEECENNRPLSLHVRISNEHAIHLYSKLGFVIHASKSNYYNNPLEGAHEMRLN